LRWVWVEPAAVAEMVEELLVQVDHQGIRAVAVHILVAVVAVLGKHRRGDHTTMAEWKHSKGQLAVAVAGAVGKESVAAVVVGKPIVVAVRLRNHHRVVAAAVVAGIAVVATEDRLDRHTGCRHHQPVHHKDQDALQKRGLGFDHSILAGEEVAVPGSTAVAAAVEGNHHRDLPGKASRNLAVPHSVSGELLGRAAAAERCERAPGQPLKGVSGDEREGEVSANEWRGRCRLQM
jgi:hypothetical protein